MGRLLDRIFFNNLFKTSRTYNFRACLKHIWYYPERAAMVVMAKGGIIVSRNTMIRYNYRARYNIRTFAKNKKQHGICYALREDWYETKERAKDPQLLFRDVMTILSIPFFGRYINIAVYKETINLLLSSTK
jgi:hypothetical protein